MNTKEAKDFFAEQAVRQAALDNVSLSGIEKRMMYFTESDPASCDAPLNLNDEFESQCDTSEYEAKMSRLPHRAHARLKGNDPERLRTWKEAMSLLKTGDHYLLVLWMADFPSDHPSRDFLKKFGIGVLFAVVAFIVMVFVTASRR